MCLTREGVLTYTKHWIERSNAHAKPVVKPAPAHLGRGVLLRVLPQARELQVGLHSCENHTCLAVFCVASSLFSGVCVGAALPVACHLPDG